MNVRINESSVEYVNYRSSDFWSIVFSLNYVENRSFNTVDFSYYYNLILHQSLFERNVKN